ncbi:5-oxoprolinase subunit PxpB [Christiangramia sp. OXR-203]|jgi:inhibitor of KinA|uniref:5-oxoprolinase subunit PxpB n=1 Tax=Christiangramia sp. OXR-203 TaxID=3100176 RepID=UPI002AC925E2|nr:5-oxoprolinase subunit PxpB [Christiangramia sp. OXR-203]WPY99620.1 5-oxoprolinase subunit PxpB [Christiangramia sp. OXR-203]
MINWKSVSKLGDRGILIEFPQEISEKTLQSILDTKAKLSKIKLEQKVEITNTYNSILISYPLTIRDVYSELNKVSEALGTTNISKNINKRIFKIPVCYEAEYAPDLDGVAALKRMKKDEVISLHSTPEYLVYFIGFLPGFLYLGGMDKKIATPRKNIPRKIVEKGSVGIAEDQTGIYPQESPGGWQIIGRTPLDFFNVKNEIPSPFIAGDFVQFYPVSNSEYLQIKEKVKNGIYEFEIVKSNG